MSSRSQLRRERRGSSHSPNEVVMFPRRHLLRFLTAAFAAAALSFGTPGRAGGGLVLVLNAANSANPGTEDAKKLFMGDVSFWPGNVPVHPVLRPSDSPAGSAFYHAIGVAPARLKRVWQEKQLSGQGTAPETVATAPALVAKVAGDPGGIGFATSDEVSAGGGVRLVPMN